MNYWRVETASPLIKVADVENNKKQIVAMAKKAVRKGVKILVFPELALTGYSCGDLFGQSLLMDATKKAALELKEELPHDMLVLVGAPLHIDNALYNCGLCYFDGELINVAVKTCIPNYKEFYEKRWFHSAKDLTTYYADFHGEQVPINSLITLRDKTTGDDVTVGVEICEDMWVTIPPSCGMALSGAEIIANLSASNEVVGKREYRRTLVEQQSARCLSAYAYASSGAGESTTDVVFSGDCCIAENGVMLAESHTFHLDEEAVICDIDVENLRQERAVNVSFADHRDYLVGYDIVECTVEKRTTGTILRQVNPHPFIPADSSKLAEQCGEITDIQSMALVKRLSHIGCKNVVIGVSGGLDSTLALLVTCRAFDILGLSRKGIHAITMPGMGTSSKTKNVALELMKVLGVTSKTIPIGEAAESHLKDIGHNPKKLDTTYENAQARERTQVIMDYSNMVNGIVIGTGDLSELALGWCTYNGDHMSMYGVNSGVPKTLIRYLVEGYKEILGGKAAKVLDEVVHIPISPELLPADSKGNIAQKTEDIIGPYELHDFFLFHMIRHGEGPAKIYALAKIAFKGIYTPAVIKKWLVTFYKRFFTSQFKRSCLPDGPKVGAVSLSPRGDWRMPSDAAMTLWIKEAQSL